MAVTAAGAPQPGKRTHRRVRQVLTWMLMLVALAGWMLFLRPASLGGPAGYVIVSGSSMEPLMHTGDLAIVQRRRAYGPGDVVAYRIPKGDVGGGMLVIHRVIGGNVEDGLVLQGDNRETPDMWRPRAQDVAGTLLVHVPHAGTALFLLRTPLVLAAMAGMFGFWLIVGRGSDPAPEVPTAADVVRGDVDPWAEVPVLRAAPAGAAPGHGLLVAGAVGFAIGLVGWRELARLR